MEEDRQGRSLTPRQLQTLNGLLALGGERPSCAPELAEQLESHLMAGTQKAVERWTGRSLYVTKGQVLTAVRCEGQLLAQALNPPERDMLPPTAVGIVTHRAIQISYTHPLRPVADYVRHALIGARTDEKFDLFWSEAGPALQSDMLMQASSRVVNFLDDWPPLEAVWSPRFEEPLSGRVGHLTLSSRVDLVIGRPRPDFRQSLLLCDLKSGNLRDEHEDEAMFYALVATLRHRVAPWRSMVYSLASGEYTYPEVDAERLFEVADKVVLAVNAIAEVLTETREPELSPGAQCSYCPARATCPAYQALASAEGAVGRELVLTEPA